MQRSRPQTQSRKQVERKRFKSRGDQSRPATRLKLPFCFHDIIQFDILFSAQRVLCPPPDKR